MLDVNFCFDFRIMQMLNKMMSYLVSCKQTMFKVLDVWQELL